MKKVQLPVVGGIRKTIVIPDASLATTLQGYAGSTLTVAQLRAILGVTTTTNTGNGNIGTPGKGAAPTQPPQVFQFVFGDDGGGGDSGSGPPGQQGAPGTNGATGSPGPAGPAVYLTAEPGEDAWPAVPGNPGVAGVNGATGSAGPAGPAVMFFAEDGAEGDTGPPGATGPAGPGVTAFSGVSVSASVDQSLTSLTNNTLVFNVSSYDTGGYHSNVTNNSRLTAPSTGYYLIIGNFRFNATATPASYFILSLNGSNFVVLSVAANSQLGPVGGISLAWEGKLNASDYVELVMFPSGNTGLDHTATFFSMSLRGT